LEVEASSPAHLAATIKSERATLGKVIGPALRIDDPRQWDFLVQEGLGTIGSRMTELSDIGRKDRPQITFGKMTGLGAGTPVKGSSAAKLLKEAERQGIQNKKIITAFKDKLDEAYDLEEGTLKREARLRELNKAARRLLEEIQR